MCYISQLLSNQNETYQVFYFQEEQHLADFSPSPRPPPARQSKRGSVRSPPRREPRCRQGTASGPRLLHVSGTGQRRSGSAALPRHRRSVIRQRQARTRRPRDSGHIPRALAGTAPQPFRFSGLATATEPIPARHPVARCG